MASKVSKRASVAQIRKALIDAIGGRGTDVASRIAMQFGISKQAVNSHLRELTATGVIVAKGATKGRRYELTITRHVQSYLLTEGLEEHHVWESFVRPLLTELPDNVVGICQYGLTEMLNNAIEHSSGRKVVIDVERSIAGIALFVHDDGVGVFRKLKESLGLEDEQHAVLELSKGKLTTDPEHHTGEGIFFSSRAFDEFAIQAGGLYLTHDAEGDWLLETGRTPAGSTILMRIAANAERVLKGVFDQFTSEARPYSFAVTHVPVALATVGAENLVSRSQARRLMARLHLFDTVVLNFAGVSEVGQAFADEVFRVYANEHPGLSLSWVGANDSVASMVHRALAEKARSTPAAPGSSLDVLAGSLGGAKSLPADLAAEHDRDLYAPPAKAKRPGRPRSR